MSGLSGTASKKLARCDLKLSWPSPNARPPFPALDNKFTWPAPLRSQGLSLRFIAFPNICSIRHRSPTHASSRLLRRCSSCRSGLRHILSRTECPGSSSRTPFLAQEKHQTWNLEEQVCRGQTYAPPTFCTLSLPLQVPVEPAESRWAEVSKAREAPIGRAWLVFLGFALSFFLSFFSFFSFFLSLFLSFFLSFFLSRFLSFSLSFFLSFFLSFLLSCLQYFLSCYLSMCQSITRPFESAAPATRSAFGLAKMLLPPLNLYSTYLSVNLSTHLAKALRLPRNLNFILRTCCACHKICA